MASLYQLLDVLCGLFRLFRRFHILDAHFQQFFSAVADQMAIGIVHIQKMSLHTRDPETIHRRADNRLILILRALYGFSRTLPNLLIRLPHLGLLG
ncbi:MAG: hypothetical protein KJ606_12605 [Chloroflexi bacterium]|nr:hypothetical protein [Chloroflexota bacterium]